MTERLAFWALMVLGGLWTAGWAFVMLRARPGPSYEALAPGLASGRRRLLVAFGVVLLAVFAISLRQYPYRPFRVRALGAPVDSVQVTGLQWAWQLDHQLLPAHVPVEFIVRSRDVNHDFGIYGPGGTLLVQVQVMPGYTNRLVYRFDRPGTYTVRCLEYCGIYHHIMTTIFTVR